jgi:alkylhydroperoxidase family enzyme
MAALYGGDIPRFKRAVYQIAFHQGIFTSSYHVPVDMGSRELKKAGETADRLFSVAAWREAPYFTEAERAALALAEAITRLSGQSDPVPEDIWNEATLHYDERALAGLILCIATTNLFNRINATTKQVAGEQPWSGH